MDDVDRGVAKGDRLGRANEHRSVQNAEPGASSHRHEPRLVVWLDREHVPRGRRKGGHVIAGPGSEIDEITPRPVGDIAHGVLDPPFRIDRSVLDLVGLRIALNIQRWMDTGQPESSGLRRAGR